MYGRCCHRDMVKSRWEQHTAHLQLHRTGEEGVGPRIRRHWSLLKSGNFSSPELEENQPKVTVDIQYNKQSEMHAIHHLDTTLISDHHHPA